MPTAPCTGDITYYRLTRLGYYSTELTRVTPSLVRRDGQPANAPPPAVAVGWPVYTTSLRNERGAELWSPAKVQTSEQKPSALDAGTKTALQVAPNSEKKEAPLVVASSGAPWEGASFDAHPL